MSWIPLSSLQKKSSIFLNKSEFFRFLKNLGNRRWYLLLRRNLIATSNSWTTYQNSYMRHIHIDLYEHTEIPIRYLRNHNPHITRLRNPLNNNFRLRWLNSYHCLNHLNNYLDYYDNIQLMSDIYSLSNIPEVIG